MCRGDASKKLDSFSREMGVPVIGMDSPRGVNDPSKGALAETLPNADLVLLLAKNLDFTLRMSGESAFGSECRFLQIDPDRMSLDLTQRVVGDPSRILLSAIADPISSIVALTQATAAIVVVVPLIIPMGIVFGIDPIHLGIIFRSEWRQGRDSFLPAA